MSFTGLMIALCHALEQWSVSYSGTIICVSHFISDLCHSLEQWPMSFTGSMTAPCHTLEQWSVSLTRTIVCVIHWNSNHSYIGTMTCVMHCNNNQCNSLEQWPVSYTVTMMVLSTISSLLPDWLANITLINLLSLMVKVLCYVYISERWMLP